MTPTMANGDRGELSAEALAMLCELRAEPALTTDEIAAIVDTPQSDLQGQLEALRESGYVKSKDVGETVAWWVDC